jgi:LIM homeobox protein 2/9
MAKLFVKMIIEGVSFDISISIVRSFLFFRRSSSCICTRCNIVIKQNEIIHRVEDLIFHLECFTCVNCNILLHPGDEFGLKDNHIYCRDHFITQQSLNSHLILDDSGYHTSPNETRQSKIDEENFLTLSPYYTERENDQLNHSKQKRLRTSFKHQQLRYMRSYFNLNHNPGLELICFYFQLNFFFYI